MLLLPIFVNLVLKRRNRITNMREAPNETSDDSADSIIGNGAVGLL